MASFNVGGSTLMLHAGAEAVTWDQVCAVETPRPTRSFCPIPHATLVDECVSALDRIGYSVTESAHALRKNGAHYFGLLALSGKEYDRGDARSQWVIGIRNGNDGMIRAGGVLAKRMFVCDNLAFGGSETRFAFSRKHTTHAMRDLPFIVNDRVNALPEYIGQAQRFEDEMSGWDFSVVEEQNGIPQRMILNDFLLSCLTAGAINISALPRIVSEFDRLDGPSGGAGESIAWERPTMFRLLQAVTEVDKEGCRLHAVERRHGAFNAIASRTMRRWPMLGALPDSPADLYYKRAVVPLN
jgi:hypothetical protein